MKRAIRAHASAWASFQIPVSPGEIRPSRTTAVASVKTSDAPPTARLPRCTSCQLFGIPSSEEYWHIGETTIRFRNVTERCVNGVKRATGATTPPSCGLFPATVSWLNVVGQRSIRRSSGGAKPSFAYSRCMSRVWRMNFVLAIGSSIDGEAHELDAEPLPARLLEHEDVGEIRDRVPVRDDAREADLAAVGRVEPDHPRRRRDQLVHHLARTAGSPVGLTAQIAVHGGAIDPRRIVVELEAV